MVSMNSNHWPAAAIVVSILLLCEPCSGQAKAKKQKVVFDATALTETYIKENCNDPAKLSIVKISKPFERQNWRFFDGDEDDRNIPLAW
jgi:hypothetical protein